ncbi:protein RST1-like isoform X3 [Papaver somniferum]|uniref:protein RST1-like isoform X3 n=1 Tax=Papaver somniferum TaxID=3469 RepID=UPI000E700948|nr:protein RST1-like isoform X3 [Papaver somniferum]
MEIYASLLERTRVSQPSIQRFAVISIFEKLRSSNSNTDSDSGKIIISQCLNSDSSHVVDQSVRELCLNVKLGFMNPSLGLLELQSVLEGCDSRFVDLFIKGIGFLVNFQFQKLGFSLDSQEHPFVKVVCCRIEVENELVQQVLSFIVRNKNLVGFGKVCEFLKPFLNFVILRIPFSSSGSDSASFAKHLISSIASLCCLFPSEALPIVKLLMGCLKYFPCRNTQDFKDVLYVAECLVNAYTVVLRFVVENGLLKNETQLCGVELLGILLSLCNDRDKRMTRKESVIELAKRLLVVHKELQLQFEPELLSAMVSLFLILGQAELEHEQLCILKLSLFMLNWKRENAEHVLAKAVGGFSEELLLIFPVINLLSSPSRSVKAAASDLLSVLENILIDLLVERNKITNIQERLPTISTPESIVSRMMRHQWFQDQASLHSSYFLSIVSNTKCDFEEVNNIKDSWVSQLKEYCVVIVDKQKSSPISQTKENLVTDMPVVLASLVSLAILHPSLGRYAIGSLEAIGLMDPKMGLPMLLAIIFYNRILSNDESTSHEIVLELLEMLPSLASHPGMIPFIVQTIVPMLQRDTKPVLRATATRLLCKTWEVTDRVFGSLQGILQPKAFQEFVNEKNICISMAASVRDVCRKNPDRGVDLILSVSACIESRDPTVKALGFQSLGHLCEADVVDFYTAWDVIAKHVLGYSIDPIIANSLCLLLRWGALDAEAYPEASKSVSQILWEVGTSSYATHGYKWAKARTSAFESLTHYEVEHIKTNIHDFNKRNVEVLISEVDPDVLRAVEKLEVKIITFEHINRRRLLKEKRVVVHKVEKLLDVFPQTIFKSGARNNNASKLPGAALLCLSFVPKDLQYSGKSEVQDLQKLHTAYENALVDIADSLHLSRNILIALLSLQSWKPFVQRWMKAVLKYQDSKSPSNLLERTTKAADDILKRLTRIAEQSVPRSSENITLAVGAFCMVLPPSAHAITTTASKFLLKLLYQYEHEHKQWSAAVGLGLVSGCVHSTDRKHKYQIISGLLKVGYSSKSSLVKGACMVGLGFASQDLLTRVEVAADVVNSEDTNRLMESNLLGKIVTAFSLMICQLSPSSAECFESLCGYVPLDTDDPDTDNSVSLFTDGNYMEEDVWGVAGVIMGLGHSVNAIYRAGGSDSVIKMKTLLKSWVPHVNLVVQSSHTCSAESAIMLSIGSCLALPTVVAFCQRVELIDDNELNCVVNGYKDLISELLSVKKSGIFHESMLMASCIGAGSLLSCILDEGVRSMKSENVNGLMELCRRCYSNTYPPTVHFGAMLGVVNALGAGAGALTIISSKPSNLQAGHGTMLSDQESSFVRGPILSNAVCEPLSASSIQEMFLVAQDSKDQQLQKYASWAVSFLRHRWCADELKNGFQSDSNQSKLVSRSFLENSGVWQLCTWLADLNYSQEGTITHVNTVETVLRCLSFAPRLPSLDWGAIIRRCMIYEDQVSGKLFPGATLKKGNLREGCLQFALAHANQVDSLLYFLDELTDLSRFRTLELNLQTCLLCHLAELIKIFAGSRLSKLFDDMADYFSSVVSSPQTYNPHQKSLLRVSFWKGLYWCLNEASNGSAEYVANLEKCMELLFVMLPVQHFDPSLRDGQMNSIEEWSEAVRCLGKTRQSWLMNTLEVLETSQVQGVFSTEHVKKIQAATRLVMTGCIPWAELGKMKFYVLNSELVDVWDVLVEVVAALQHADGSTKRKWLVDAMEITCMTKNPSTALHFIGLLGSSFCKYMPLLTIDPVTVLSDLPITLPSLLSNSSWKVIAESVVFNLWVSTQRVYDWAKCLATNAGDNDNEVTLRQPQQHPIDTSENGNAIFLARLLHETCVSLKDYLPLDKQLRLANMVLQ